MLAKPITNIPPKYRRTFGGCEGCRTRHIRCDKQLPGCAQCAKRGAQCLGYDRQYRFVAGPSVRKERQQDRLKGTRLGHGNFHEAAPTYTGGPPRSEGPGADGGAVGDTPRALTAAHRQPPVKLAMFDPDLAEDCRRGYYLDYFFNHVADLLSIVGGSLNPFREDLRHYSARSDSLSFTLMAMASLQLAASEPRSGGTKYAWHYRTLALRSLREDIGQKLSSVEVLMTVLLLAISETSFDGNCSAHLEAAQKLVLQKAYSGQVIPPFLTHCLCWVETLTSFVADIQHVVVSSPTAYARLVAGGGKSTVVDPLLGTWASLMPSICQVGVITRRLRKDNYSGQFNELIQCVETDLLEWEHVYPLRSDEQETAQPPTIKPSEFHTVAEAYRRTALLILYKYSPSLLRSRVSARPDLESSEEFLSELAHSVFGLLRRIPIGNKLWHVCSLPILSAAQLMTESSDRDFILSVKGVIKDNIQLPTCDKVTMLLKDVWARRDAGLDVWWMDVLDEEEFPILIN